MYKSNRGSYRKQESLIKEFSNSCLGRAVIGVAIMIVLAIVALITNPSAETMQAEMRDNIRQCIQENDIPLLLVWFWRQYRFRSEQ